MIAKIFIDSLRSLKKLEYEFCTGITIVHGPNGSGKTTVLEAIHLLSQGFSFRARDLKELIAWKSDSFMLRGDFKSDIVDGLNTKQTLRALKVEKKNCIVHEDKETLRSPAAFFGKIPAVIMQPSDIDLLRGAPEIRRKWIDEILCYKSPLNASLLKKYRRVLQQRNQWLRQLKILGNATGGEQLFEILTEQLIDLGAKLWCARMALSKEISPIITSYYRKLSGGVDEIECAYKSSILKELDALDGAEFMGNSELEISATKNIAADIVANYNANELSEFGEQQMQEAFRRKLSGLFIAERAQGITLAGPHKDDLAVSIGSACMRSAGSQGQCRCASIAMRFAAVDVAEHYLSKPIILLDDIFAELDINRRSAVAELICKKSCQVVIATPQLKELPFKANAELALS